MFEKETPDKKRARKTTENPDGTKITVGEPSDDAYAWKQEFDFTPEEIASRGEPIGYMRFVAFQPNDDEKMSVMSDGNADKNFTKAFVAHIAGNDELFQYMKKVMSSAEMYRDISNDDITSIMRRMMRTSYPPGGPLNDMDELFELFGVKRPRHKFDPLMDILGSLGRDAARDERREFEAHVIGIKRKKTEKPDGFSSLVDLLRTVTNGEGCNCPICTEIRERNAKENTSADQREDDPERNGTE